MTTIKAKRRRDGTLVEQRTARILRGKTDWKRLDAKTEAEINRAALADPDAQPLTAADLRSMKRVPRVKTLRRALGLTQEEFALRYRIPVGTLRDWEQGRSKPDRPARAYLTVIACNPRETEAALWGSMRKRGAGPR